MDINLILHYIKARSSKYEIKESNNVKLNIEFKTHSYYRFSCIINGEIDTRINLIDQKIRASCNCSHETNGSCKHIVAAFRYLTNNAAEIDAIGAENAKSNPTKSALIATQKKAKSVDNSKPKLKYNQIEIPDGLITFEVIDSCAKRSGNSPYQTNITSISPSKVSIEFGYWNLRHSASLNYSVENEILDLDCTCPNKKNRCEHIRLALEKIESTFGYNYFHKNYFQDFITQHLAQFGMTIEDNYNEIFKYDLTPNGIKVFSKYKNIQPQIQEEAVISLNENLQIYSAIGYRSTTEKPCGMGICFVFDKKKFITITPVVAKYNKQRDDLSSGFSPINFANLNDSLLVIEEPSTQEIMLKTIQITDLLNRYEVDSNYLKKAIQLLQELVPKFDGLFIFKFDANYTLTRKNLVPIQMANSPIKLFFTLAEDDLFYTLKPKIKIGEKNYNINASKLSINKVFILAENIVYPIPNIETSSFISHYQSIPESNYLKKDFEEMYQKVIIPLSKKFEIESSIFKKDKSKIEDEILEKHVYISDFEGECVVFKLAVQYPNQLISVFSNEFFNHKVEADQKQTKLSYTERNDSFEDNFKEEFVGLHHAFSEQDGIYYLSPEQLIENYWMLHATERMAQMGIKVFGANNLKSFKFNTNKAVVRIALKSDIDWFDLEIEISFGNQIAGLKELQKAFLKKTNYVALGDGTLGILPEEWIKKLAKYFKVGEIKKNGIKLSNYQFGIIDELFDEIEKKPPFLLELLEKKKRLQNISEIATVEIPKGIKAKLRDYQHHGLNWLAFLDQNQLGGCLADDMGLGKTLQAITFLQYLKLKDKKCLPSLIIAPTSLIFNWRNEIEKFCPSLKLLTFVGPNRMDLKDQFSKNDLVISTYGSLLNDIETMRNFRFNYVILDESQAIKNPNSKRYKAVKLLNSYGRLVLTGTPIENNTFDLYAQMNFINPGLLGNMTHFKTEFSDAIDKEKNVEASQLLGQMIAPFLLRRTKEQVAKELPEKTESIIYCEMEKEQRKVYDTFKNKYRDYLLHKIDENGVGNAQMYILEGLTKLRQICNSTAMINDEEDYGNHSIKLDLLIENIKEKTGNHKILVFSQFVKMLTIIKNRLDEDQISYEYLDGQTQNREDRVNNFQNNTKIRVFLISLKAGGTGLNLTEADYVFLVDPWWNPAVENQAIDRCYRIGQKQKVMAYRMICKDTIEEKIVALQGKKKAVASSIISIDDEKKSFDVDMVKSLFS